MKVYERIVFCISSTASQPQHHEKCDAMISVRSPLLFSNSHPASPSASHHHSFPNLQHLFKAKRNADARCGRGYVTVTKGRLVQTANSTSQSHLQAHLIAHLSTKTLRLHSR